MIYIKNYSYSCPVGETVEIPSKTNVFIKQQPNNNWGFSVNGDLSSLTERELSTKIKLLDSPVMTLKEFLEREELL